MKLYALVALIVVIIAYQYIQIRRSKKQQEQETERLQAEQARKKKIPDVRVRIFQGRWDPKKVKQRPECLFIFGDNEDEVGKGGQAIIRDQSNAAGIPTKLRPYMNEDSFYSDEDFADNKAAIDEAIDEIHKKLSMRTKTGNKYSCIMFPQDGLGTGRSELPRRAPETYSYLLDALWKLAYKYDPEGADAHSATAWGPWLQFLKNDTRYEMMTKKRIGV